MKIIKQVKAKIYELARQGINNKTIYESLQIPKSTFYRNKDLLDTLKKLMQDVSSMLLSQAQTDTTALIFLAKRLNLFSGDIKSTNGTKEP